VANTIEITEVQNLPMITRTISGMLELLPGAAPQFQLVSSQFNAVDGRTGGAAVTMVTLGNV
jgi:hypothetical protein